MTVLPRAATAPELALMRSDGQSTRWYLTFDNPAEIYRARLAAVPASTDQCASITYNTGAGVGGKTYADILADMTILVSAVGYGEYDLGEVRLRNTTGLGAAAGTFNIAEESEIDWAADAYLTVIDEFNLWPRHIRIDPTDGTTPLMDYDVPLGSGAANQNITSGAIPTPVIGPDAVLWLRGASVIYYPDASNSWVKDGTVTGWAWACAGATVTNGTTATPTITFTSVGSYRLSCTVTGDNGVSFTGYRRVFVVTESSGVTTQFELSSPPTGDYNAGGWSARVTLYDEATLTLVRDRAMVILHSVDYYGNTRGSIGYVPGCENIRMVGRIAGESIVWGTEDKWGSVSFDIEGPQYWFGRMTAFPSGVKDVDITPNKWTKFLGLTLNKAWYHFMRWRSTATRMMDVYPNIDGRRHKRLESPGGENIWAQLIEIATRSMLANPCCDRYGRLFLEIEQQLVSDRSSMPVVQALTSADWIDEIRMDRVTVDEAALIDLSGVTWDGATAVPLFSLAPGHVFRHYGGVEVVDRLMLTSSQADTNILAGLYSAWKNNPYPRIDVKFGCNHHLIDIAPYQRLTLAIAAGDTPRGIAESLTVIPRTITDDFDQALGAVLTTVTFEAEVTAALAITGDTPPVPPAQPPGPIVPPVEPPPIDPVEGADASEVWIFTSDAAYWSGDYFNGGQPTWNKIAVGGGNTTWAGITSGGVVYYRYMTDVFYHCGNQKDATPTYDDILHMGIAPFANVAATYTNMLIYQNKLITIVKLAYPNPPINTRWMWVEYDGAAWTTTYLDDVNTFGPELVGPDFYGFDAAVLSYPSKIPIDGSSWGVGFVGWTTKDGAQLFALSNSGVAGSHVWLRRVLGTDVVDFGAQSNPDDAVINTVITGARDGNNAYCVDVAGKLYVASSGLGAFTNVAQWVNGWVYDSKRAGGGPLVWTPRVLTASNVPSRLYNQSGGLISDMTGNFWDLATGDQTIIGCGLVY